MVTVDWRSGRRGARDGARQDDVAERVGQVPRLRAAGGGQGRQVKSTVHPEYSTLTAFMIRKYVYARANLSNVHVCGRIC